MNAKVSDIVSLLKNITNPDDCTVELSIALRLNVPGTDMFIDVAVITLPVVDENGETRFGALPRRCDWALTQLDMAGYYVDDPSDVVSQGPDLFTVFINRHVQTR